MIVLLAFPLAWSSLTAANPHPDTILPSAYSGGQALQRDQWPAVDQRFLTYLQDRTQGSEYLAAVPNAVIGAPYVLASGRPVLYLGGFSGTDPVASPDSLAILVNSGRLKYVWDLGDLPYQQPVIAEWLASHCQIVNDAPLPDARTLGIPGGPVLPEVAGRVPAYHQALYLCMAQTPNP
jgi:4-amino-4-deoxy-L-arabinose transferase-like glycosyltransferase